MLYLYKLNKKTLLELIVKAVVTGFILSVLIGPVFFMLLDISIRKGIRAALSFDLGVLLSDIIYILIAYLFYNQVAHITSGDQQYLFKLIGGTIFIIFGLFMLIKKPKEEVEKDNITFQTKDYLTLGLKGFLLNFANPAVIIYWFSVIANGVQGDGKSIQEGQNLELYIIIILITFFSVDVLKVVGAKKLRPFITDKVLVGLNRLTGLIIFITGIVLLLKGIVFILELNTVDTYVDYLCQPLNSASKHLSPNAW